MSMKEKKVFAKMFQSFDSLFAQLKSFTKYDDTMLEEYGFTEEEYDEYVGHYKNVMEEIHEETPDGGGSEKESGEEIDQDYELMAYSNTKIDYEYIINLIQNIVTPVEEGSNRKIACCAILLLSPFLSYPGFSTGKIPPKLSLIGLEWNRYK